MLLLVDVVIEGAMVDGKATEADTKAVGQEQELTGITRAREGEEKPDLQEAEVEEDMWVKNITRKRLHSRNQIEVWVGFKSLTRMKYDVIRPLDVRVFSIQ